MFGPVAVRAKLSGDFGFDVSITAQALAYGESRHCRIFGGVNTWKNVSRERENEGRMDKRPAILLGA